MKNDKKKQWIVFAVIAIIIIIMVNQPNKKTNELGMKIHYYTDGKEVYPENNMFSLVSLGALNYCYQESANISTACGGLNTGTYGSYGTWNPVFPVNNLYDGGWTTLGTTGISPQNLGYMFVNYSKPFSASSTSLWQVKDENGIRNLTIPSDCWNNGDTLQFRVASNTVSTYYTSWDCYNGVTWKNISTIPTKKNIYEEAMIWKSGTYADAISVDIIGTNTGNVPIDLTIQNVYPIELQNALPTNNARLYIGDNNKVLWRSGQIATTSLEKYSKPFSPYVNISGIVNNGTANAKIYSLTSTSLSVWYEQMVSFRTNDLTYQKISSIIAYCINGVCGNNLTRYSYVGSKTTSCTPACDCSHEGTNHYLGPVILNNLPATGPYSYSLTTYTNISGGLAVCHNLGTGMGYTFNYYQPDNNANINNVRHLVNPAMEVNCTR